MALTAVCGLLGCALLWLGVAAPAARLSAFPARVRCAAVLAAAAVLLVPFGDLSIAAYVRGATGDLSAATLVLAGGALVCQLTGRRLPERREVDALLWLVVAEAAFLYPFALGWTPFDPYALGYNSIVFISVLLLLTLAAWRAGRTLVVLVVLLGALAFLGGVYESRNLWDYLVDPLVAAYALVALPARLIRRYLASEATARV